MKYQEKKNMVICRQWRNHLDINVRIEGQTVLYYNCLSKYLFF